jgi:hypothetical protein
VEAVGNGIASERERGRELGERRDERRERNRSKFWEVRF